MCGEERVVAGEHLPAEMVSVVPEEHGGACRVLEIRLDSDTLCLFKLSELHGNGKVLVALLGRSTSNHCWLVSFLRNSIDR